MRQLIYHGRLLLLAGVLLASGQAAADEAANWRTAMAVENVQLARTSCGYEVTFLARNLMTRDRGLKTRPFAEERDVVANLWRQTWACKPGFAGENCIAARLQLCRRAYLEYGPEGILVKGLLKAVVKK